jgi:hypothetical protein
MSIMYLKERATQVKVKDASNDKVYYYWVNVLKPETAKRAAIKKHCGVMGVVPTEALTAEIVEKPTENPDEPVNEKISMRHWMMICDE